MISVRWSRSLLACVIGPAFVALGLVGCEGRRPGAGRPRPDAADARILLLGIDGADWDRAIPLMRQGKMPALEKLTTIGARRTLRSLVPDRLSPTIWTSAATGVLPEKHGIHNFVGKGPDGSLQPVTSNQRRVAALWNIFTARKKTVGVVGWLATWPAESVNGYLVSSYTPFVFDWGAGKPLKGTLVEGIPHQVWPPELQAELESLKVLPTDIAASTLEQRFDLAAVPKNPSTDARESIDGMQWSWAADETYLNVWRRLADRPPGGSRPQLEMLYYGTVDVLSHRFWKYMEPSSYVLGKVDPEEVRFYGRAVEAAYQTLDGVIHEVMGKESEPMRFVVLSDHGFRENQDPARTTSSGWHRTEGMFLAVGPGIRSGALLSPGSVVDVAPTVLYASGLPAAEDMDAGPDFDLFTDEFRAEHKPELIPSYESEVERRTPEGPVASPVDEEILARLRALGYID